MPTALPVLAAGPKIVVDQPSVDLGTVTRGDVREARFALRNAGDAVLHILRVDPG